MFCIVRHNENEVLNDKSGNKFDDNDQMSSEDEEDAVEEVCEDNIDSIYNIDDINKLNESDTGNSTTEESRDEVAKLKTLDVAKYHLD